MHSSRVQLVAPSRRQPSLAISCSSSQFRGKVRVAAHNKFPPSAGGSAPPELPAPGGLGAEAWGTGGIVWQILKESAGRLRRRPRAPRVHASRKMTGKKVSTGAPARDEPAPRPGLPVAGPSRDEPQHQGLAPRQAGREDNVCCGIATGSDRARKQFCGRGYCDGRKRMGRRGR